MSVSLEFPQKTVGTVELHIIDIWNGFKLADTFSIWINLQKEWFKAKLDKKNGR